MRKIELAEWAEWTKTCEGVIELNERCDHACFYYKNESHVGDHDYTYRVRARTNSNSSPHGMTGTERKNSRPVHVMGSSDDNDQNMMFEYIVFGGCGWGMTIGFFTNSKNMFLEFLGKVKFKELEDKSNVLKSGNFWINRMAT